MAMKHDLKEFAAALSREGIVAEVIGDTGAGRVKVGVRRGNASGTIIISKGIPVGTTAFKNNICRAKGAIHGRS